MALRLGGGEPFLLMYNTGGRVYLYQYNWILVVL